MTGKANEPFIVDYNFILIAEQIFEKGSHGKNETGKLLDKLNLAGGAVSSLILTPAVSEYDNPGTQNHPDYRISATSATPGLVSQVAGNPLMIQHLLTHSAPGLPLHFRTSEIKATFPDLNLVGSGTLSYFPFKTSEEKSGYLCMEFSGAGKDWTQLELKVMELFTGMLARFLENSSETTSPLEDVTDYYSEVFEYLPAAIVILDPDGNVERINQEFTRLFLWEAHEISGKNLDDILPDFEDRQSARQLTSRILNGERVLNEGLRYRKDGSAIYVSLAGVVSQPASGRNIIFCIYNDITDRVQAQEKLKESQARFRILFEYANDAIFIIKDGFVIDCNAKTLEIFRCTREEILGKSAIDLSPQRQPNGLLSLNQAVKYSRAALGREQQTLEWMHKRPDGSLFMAEVSINIFEWKGEDYTQAIVRDISSRKQTELLLKQRYEFIAFLNRVSADMINPESDSINASIQEIVTYSGKYTSCSRALIYLLETDSTNLILSYKWDADPGRLMPVLEKMLISDLPGIYNSLVSGETIIREVPEDQHHTDDMLITEILDLQHFQSFILIPLSVGSRLIGFTGYFSEKTIYSWTDDIVTPLKLTNQMVANAVERSRIDKELKMAKEKAVESDKLKTAFLSSMSHEIRTPMNHILGFIELLKDPSLLDSEKKEFMEIVKSSGNMLLRLIDDIIDIAKLESGQLVISHVDLSLNKFLDDIYYMFNEQLNGIRKNSIQFEVHMPTVSLADTINTDPLRLRQIVSILLSNALKFTLQGKIIFGYTFLPENRIHFFVEDTGIGIPEEKHGEVFERFRQLDGGYAREFSGTGLGLAIAKGLVELMKGEIGLVSEPGRGSRFHFTIPYKPVEIQVESQGIRTINAGEYDFSEKNILVVEDDEVNFRFLEIVIQKTHANAFRAVTGSEAIELALKQEIDLVLMDIQIPVIDGYMATRKIKEIKPWLPIIAQTAHALAEERDKCLNSGADEYLSKPIGRKELLSKMALFLKSENC